MTSSLCSLYEAEVGAGKHLFLVAHFMLLRPAGWGSLVIWYSFYNKQTIFSQSSSLPRLIQKFHKEEAEILSSYEVGMTESNAPKMQGSSQKVAFTKNLVKNEGVVAIVPSHSLFPPSPATLIHPCEHFSCNISTLISELILILFWCPSTFPIKLEGRSYWN